MAPLYYRPRIPKRQFYTIVFLASTTALLFVAFVSWLITPLGPYVVFGTAILSTVYGVFIERRWVQLTRREVYLAGLPTADDGFRIVHLSDIHWDTYTNPARLQAIFEGINALEPEMIVLTGDLITHYRKFIEPCARSLGRLRARHGVYAVLGNHDHWANGPMLRAALQQQAIRVLTNEHARIRDAFWLVGVDDPHLQFSDLDAALRGIPHDRLPRILLAHSPDIMGEAQGRVDLVLAGHTHGGQVRFPWLGPLMRATRRRAGKPFIMGMKRAGTTLCFTNRGLGTVLLPIRFNCRPEVALITLHSC